jgi:hypothetical protein
MVNNFSQAHIVRRVMPAAALAMTFPPKKRAAAAIFM